MTVAARSTTLIRTLVGLLVLVLGCTEVPLERPPDPPPGAFDDKLALSGEFCSRDPSLVPFPVKILFVIDTSQSLNVTDPDCGRCDAVEEIIETVASEEGVEIAVVSFNGSSAVLTQTDTDGDGALDADGFTQDPEMLAVAVAELSKAGATTDYEGALGLAVELLAGDMLRTRRSHLSRSKYVVIFHSDGLPNPVTPDSNTNARIWDRVEQLVGLQDEFPVRDIRLHTTYLSVDTPPDIKTEATTLLRGMAQRGGGTFRDFDVGSATSFVQIDFASVRRLFALKSLLALNANALPRGGETLVDTDADGIVDDQEARIGADFQVHDSDGDGFHDLLEHRLRTSGYDPIEGYDADCLDEADSDDRLDTDGDGLVDCEERFVGTSPTLFDSDADGFPDGVEYHFGTNPSGDDTEDDPDFDGAPNHIELRAHMDPRVADVDKMADVGYRTTVERIGFEGERQCYRWSVENITLVPTGERQIGKKTERGINDVFVYINEVPFDDPDDFGFYSVACVRARYRPELELKLPGTGRMRLDQSLFVAPELFDPTLDCIEAR